LVALGAELTSDRDLLAEPARALGDLEAGAVRGDVVVERTFRADDDVGLLLGVDDVRLVRLARRRCGLWRAEQTVVRLDPQMHLDSRAQLHAIDAAHALVVLRGDLRGRRLAVLVVLGEADVHAAGADGGRLRLAL